MVVNMKHTLHHQHIFVVYFCSIACLPVCVATFRFGWFLAGVCLSVRSFACGACRAFAVCLHKDPMQEARSILTHDITFPAKVLNSVHTQTNKCSTQAQFMQRAHKKSIISVGDATFIFTLFVGLAWGNDFQSKKSQTCGKYCRGIGKHKTSWCVTSFEMQGATAFDCLLRLTLAEPSKPLGRTLLGLSFCRETNLVLTRSHA